MTSSISFMELNGAPSSKSGTMFLLSDTFDCMDVSGDDYWIDPVKPKAFLSFPDLDSVLVLELLSSGWLLEEELGWLVDRVSDCCLSHEGLPRFNNSFVRCLFCQCPYLPHFWHRNSSCIRRRRSAPPQLWFQMLLNRHWFTMQRAFRSWLSLLSGRTHWRKINTTVS